MIPKILIVDDERMLVETIEFNLQKAGFETVVAFDGESALAQARTHQPQLVILDLMLPKISGWEVCRALRQDPEYRLSGPILMLTARGEESDKVIGLELGADDYMVKPFGMRELVARVRALLRRSEAAPSADGDAALQVGPVHLDVSRHEVRLLRNDEAGAPAAGSSNAGAGADNGREIKLSLKEFELLRALMSQSGKAVTRENLLESVWGNDFYGDERTLDVHIRWLREKLEANPSQPQHILTVRGVGYKFKG
ncbi:MAG: two-component system, OmpR family, alkaline phosphatase synthesis response regulator PhoP [Abditibacteriota bacterium]|nr:two-component system, OmpR family, alkaline phosphatase synthesis response regulator PhoP [Abditibacteriota bacterium]